MSRSTNQQKVNQGHRKSYSRMKKYGRRKERQAVEAGATSKEAKIKKHVQ